MKPLELLNALTAEDLDKAAAEGQMIFTFRPEDHAQALHPIDYYSRDTDLTDEERIAFVDAVDDYYKHNWRMCLVTRYVDNVPYLIAVRLEPTDARTKNLKFQGTVKLYRRYGLDHNSAVRLATYKGPRLNNLHLTLSIYGKYASNLMFRAAISSHPRDENAGKERREWLKAYQSTLQAIAPEVLDLSKRAMLSLVQVYDIITKPKELKKAS